MKQHKRKDSRPRRLRAIERMEQQVAALHDALARAENNKADVATVFAGGVPQMWPVSEIWRDITRITTVIGNTYDNMR